jgi:hypothetical protein
MKRTVLLKALFGMALAFPVLFNGCDTALNGKSAAPGELEGEWEGQSELGDPVLMIISGNMMTLESLGSKVKGTCETKDGTIIYRPTYIYDNDKKQFVETAEYLENIKKEYLDLLETLLEAGEIILEEYDDRKNLFVIPEAMIIPYRLEGENTLILTLDYGDAVLTRR